MDTFRYISQSTQSHGMRTDRETTKYSYLENVFIHLNIMKWLYYLRDQIHYIIANVCTNIENGNPKQKRSGTKPLGLLDFLYRKTQQTINDSDLHKCSKKHTKQLLFCLCETELEYSFLKKENRWIELE